MNRASTPTGRDFIGYSLYVSSACTLKARSINKFVIKNCFQNENQHLRVFFQRYDSNRGIYNNDAIPYPIFTLNSDGSIHDYVLSTQILEERYQQIFNIGNTLTQLRNFTSNQLMSLGNMEFWINILVRDVYNEFRPYTRGSYLKPSGYSSNANVIGLFQNLITLDFTPYSAGVYIDDEMKPAPHNA